jgi:hypothetical protein
MYTTIAQGSNTIATGFTPTSFSTISGQSYTITVSDYTNAYFNHWSNGYGVRSITVTATTSSTPLTAIYTTTPQPPPPTPDTITVMSHDSANNSPLTGFFVDLRINGNEVASGFTPVTFKNLQEGVQYGVVVYWYGDYYFRHFSDGNLNRYALVTLTATQTSVALDALYQSVPAAQSAHLDVLAKLPNGTLIGTSSTSSGGYIQHTPGMWLDIIPPGSTVPFTGTFTGGSILPFTLFNHQTYTVEMTLGYQRYHFAYWQDTGSTNPNRPVTLNGDTTVVAIYTFT